jgi:hypothetical protein
MQPIANAAYPLNNSIQIGERKEVVFPDMPWFTSVFGTGTLNLPAKGTTIQRLGLTINRARRATP